MVRDKELSANSTVNVKVDKISPYNYNSRESRSPGFDSTLNPFGSVDQKLLFTISIANLYDKFHVSMEEANARVKILRNLYKNHKTLAQNEISTNGRLAFDPKRRIN